MTLEEPPKAEVRGWLKGEAFSRRAFAVVLTDGKLGEAVINLDARTLASWTVIENRQAAITIDEIIAVGDIVNADERWRAAMAKRGITSFENILCFPLSTGPSLDPALAGGVCSIRPASIAQARATIIWGKPIENLMATHRSDRKESGIRHRSRRVAGCRRTRRATPGRIPGRRGPVTKPVEIASPQGSNISVAGGEVRWDNWSFHVRLDPRLGAVLSLIRYDDHGSPREIAYQLSASEMFVPYMDPGADLVVPRLHGYRRIRVWRAGNPASPGQDCPAGASFLDVTIADTKGAPLGLQGVVCIFERPSGDPLWRHDEAVNQTYEARPNTELVVRMAPVVGNYDYLVDYVFDRAGDIDVRLGAYGIDETKGVASSTLSDPTAAADTAYGTLIGKRLVAVNHDHYMAFRIDMDVDGTANRFVEDRIVPRRISESGPRRSLWQVESRTISGRGCRDDADQRGAIPRRKHDQEKRAGLSDRLSADARTHRQLDPRARRSHPDPRGLFGLHDVVERLCAARIVRGRLLSRTRIPMSTACRNGWPRSAPSTATTSYSGTRSGSATCRARKTGRRCPASGTASACGRSTSSTAIPALDVPPAQAAAK